MRAVRALHTSTGTELTEDERALLMDIQAQEEKLSALEAQSTLALLARVEATRLHRQCEIDLLALKQKRVSEAAGAKRAGEDGISGGSTGAKPANPSSGVKAISSSSSKPMPSKLNLSRFAKSQVPPGTKDIWAEPSRVTPLNKLSSKGGL